MYTNLTVKLAQRNTRHNEMSVKLTSIGVQSKWCATRNFSGRKPEGERWREGGALLVVLGHAHLVVPRVPLRQLHI